MGKPNDYVPRTGLSIPVVTVLDSEGRVLADEQRAAIRFAVQEGKGADIIFAAGTNGEWNRLDNPRRQKVFELAVEECGHLSAGGIPVEAWLGITGHTRAETIENLEHSFDLAADALVVAPLAIGDVSDVVDFVAHDMNAVFERHGRALPVFLYENADIAAPGKPLNLDTREVAELSKLDYIRGIKVTADRALLDSFIAAAPSFGAQHPFPIYAGNAYLIFDLFHPMSGLLGRIKDPAHKHAIPLQGIVCGPANMSPREWKRAWEVAAAGERALMDRYREVLKWYADICLFMRGTRDASLSIACLKASLAELGVITSDAVAHGTPAFDPDERLEFGRRFQVLRERAAAVLEPGWISEHVSHSAGFARRG
ncbi:MAG TPA: dihydrodipicolinate synthase family protein [Candidatus Binataceae bacterium]|nr:dihydrodipicolinate synthase family protein [Candidatus Binataceae bacterium]